MHLLLTFLEHEIDRLGERIDIVLEYIIECHDLATIATVIVAQHVVAIVLGRDEIGQSPPVGYILDSYLGYIISVFDLDLVKALGRASQFAA